MANKINCRLKKLREHISDERQESLYFELAKDLDVIIHRNNGMQYKTETLISYEQGKRVLPIEIAVEISKKFEVSLDWLYGRSEHMSERDLSIEILYCLEKFFMMSKRRTHKREDIVLLMDYRSRDFLYDIESLNAVTEMYLDNDLEFYEGLRRKKI